MLFKREKPLKTFTSLEIAEVLREIAQEKGRPHYEMIVCYAVRDAIQNDLPHPLKVDLLAYLERKPKIEFVEVSSEDNNKDLKATYSKKKVEKIDFLRKWCNEHSGGYTLIVNHTGESLHKLARKLRYTTYYEDDMLNSAYDIVMKVVKEQTDGIAEIFGTRRLEEFFIQILRLYCQGVIEYAYRKVVSGIKPHQVNWESIANLWGTVGHINAVSLSTRNKRLKHFQDKSVVVFEADYTKQIRCGFKLVDLDVCKQLYRIAFNQVYQASQEEGFKPNLTLISKSKIAEAILPMLMEHGFNVFDVSKGRKERRAAA